MAATWLCTPTDTSRRIGLLLIMLVAIFTLTSAQTHTESTVTQESENAASTQQNTLIDDLEHEEFIDSESNQPHSRRKRLIWITDDGRLALPPGTSLTFTPTIALPLVRHPPEGFFSNVSISFPVTIDFDKLGLTDNQNPLGDLPPIFARSFGHTAGQMLGNYVSRFLHVKAKRDLAEQNMPPLRSNSRFQVKQEHLQEEHEFPTLPERFKHVFHGGERVLLYSVVEDFLATFGINGKACLLRTICEMHSKNLEHFGVFGEMTKLFLTVTKSPFSDLIPEYVRAQEIGEGRQEPGECFPYYKECPRGLFKIMQSHKYNDEQKSEYYEAEAEVIPNQKLPQNREENDLKTNEISQVSTKHILPM